MDLDELYTLINDYIKQYNDLSQEEILSLSHVPKKKETLYDIESLYVCLFNKDKVGLFKKNNYAVQGSNTTYRISSLPVDQRKENGYLYITLDSHYLFLERINFGDNQGRLMLPIGTSIIIDEVKFVVNCIVDEIVPFDEIRKLMKEEKIIDHFKEGIASNEEMYAVLKYASERYFLDKFYGK